ncbi:hypothetical protein [Muriicola sp. Z0-33]|uniref:hypothetical protein n=1 Tax=Muriicola sp. Z0-33 TaxID=2816957 RepID=UPI002237ECB8|nr:hypothetical protein [Muriicola sp. Z0-33]MCW5515787.1 hypothetical protein [Muriicola sp. Z0-33]
MKQQKQRGKGRKYFIAWLRIGLIIRVFFFQLGMIFLPEKCSTRLFTLSTYCTNPY